MASLSLPALASSACTFLPTASHMEATFSDLSAVRSGVADELLAHFAAAPISPWSYSPILASTLAYKSSSLLASFEVESPFFDFAGLAEGTRFVRS